MMNESLVKALSIKPAYPHAPNNKNPFILLLKDLENRITRLQGQSSGGGASVSYPGLTTTPRLKYSQLSSLSQNGDGVTPVMSIYRRVADGDIVFNNKSYSKLAAEVMYSFGGGDLILDDALYLDGPDSIVIVYYNTEGLAVTVYSEDFVFSDYERQTYLEYTLSDASGTPRLTIAESAAT